MQVLTQIIIISWELCSYENPKITPISSKIINLSVTGEFQDGCKGSNLKTIENFKKSGTFSVIWELKL